MPKYISPRIGKAPTTCVHRKKFTKEEQLSYLRRRAKRGLLEQGFISPRRVPTWKWCLETDQGIVSANTRSEARSKIKKKLGLKRLPKDIFIEKVANDLSESITTIKGLQDNRGDAGKSLQRAG